MSVSKTKIRKNGAYSQASTLTNLQREILRLPKNKKASKRYYNAKRLEEHGYRVDHRNRTFLFHFSSLAEIPVGPRYYVLQLIRLGYTKQLSLFS